VILEPFLLKFAVDPRERSKSSKSSMGDDKGKGYGPIGGWAVGGGTGSGPARRWGRWAVGGGGKGPYGGSKDFGGKGKDFGGGKGKDDHQGQRDYERAREDYERAREGREQDGYGAMG